ncbi:DUF3106 domain-containing protein [Curvibacter sp. CHRR-16]|uniref:DUF3106 domain-containing protein n=1 Tax=Curvibacter sp. CHRR-16 TaxID=2835872 RepID=UPI001BDA3079|nr:DUF3106 domain-containing protein [Curvibacter sp. CHRR-16]MBT0568777.1 DUF3106 domain-containing protein [Curvibacter sp. CHRR-16]
MHAPRFSSTAPNTTLRNTLLAVALHAVATLAFAQLADAPPAPDALEPLPPTAPAPAPVTALPAVIAAPQWHELTSAQQEALRPLKQNWNKMADSHRRKWVALAKNFHQLASADKDKLQDRMQEWAALSNKDRDQARLNFAQTQKITPEQRLAQWQAYQALDADAKKALAEQAPKKPKGAALVVKPTAADNLPAVAPKKSGGTRNIPADPRIDPRTLLPLRRQP